MKIHQMNVHELYQSSAQMAIDQLKKKPDSVIGFATGNTTVPLHEEIVKRVKKGSVEVGKMSTVNVDEYVGLSDSDESSCYGRMDKQVLTPLQLDEGQVLFLRSIEDVELFDQTVEDRGGIDLQYLGIGLNGHIGFNEPGTPFGTMTHVVSIDTETRKDKASHFGGIEKVPRQGMTMGLRSIMMARKIVLLATGKEKANVVKRALFGPITEEVPASVLQLHPCLHVFVDPAALI